MNVVNIIEIMAVILLTLLIILLLRDRKKLILRRIVGVFVINLILIGHLSYATLIEKPIMTVIGEEFVTIEVNTPYLEQGIHVKYHNQDWSDKVEIQNGVNIQQVGEYEVSYQIKFREEYITKKRRVKVMDTIAPQLSLKGKQVVQVPENSEYIEEGYQAFDNADGDITNKVEITNQTLSDTEYQLIYTVIDQSGNKATLTRTIHKTAPIQTENPQKNGVIYLTFDDGPSLDITPKILDILKEENIKATFFILNYNKNREILVKRIVEEGHTIGIHGYSHEYKEIYISKETFMNNITKLQEKIKESTGVNTMYIRFPGGSSNTVSKKYSPGIMSQLTKKLLNDGYKYFDWNVSSGDAGGAKTKQEVYQNVTKQLKKTRPNMVLMHDFSRNTKTLEALRDIIHFGKENGYTFEKIAQDTPMITQKVAN